MSDPTPTVPLSELQERLAEALARTALTPKGKEICVWPDEWGRSEIADYRRQAAEILLAIPELHHRTPPVCGEDQVRARAFFSANAKVGLSQETIIENLAREFAAIRQDQREKDARVAASLADKPTNILRPNMGDQIAAALRAGKQGGE